MMGLSSGARRGRRSTGWSVGVLAVLTVGACDGSDDRVRMDAPPKEGETLVALTSAADDDTYTLVGGDTVVLHDATREFYERRHNRLAWVADDELTKNGRGVLAALGNARADGLSPESYRYTVAKTLATRLDGDLPDSMRARVAADLDLVLTEGFARFTSDLVSGTLNPTEAGVDWRIPRGRAMEQVILERALRGTPPEEIVAALRPAAPHYERLRQALAQYAEVEKTGGWPMVPTGATLKPGARDSAVAILRQRFLRGGDKIEAELAGRGRADATLFDPALRNAVEHFQDRHAIESDGVPGESTIRELNHTVAERMAEIKLNLDRWRWLPRELGDRYVLVNLAGFELEVIDQGKAIETMNVVVGQPSWETPVFADTMENIVVNPYWNVPASILEEEIRPAIAQDPNYVLRNNYEWVGDRLRQKPGAKNALGKYKFLFPNGDNIYLHDTPADHLFSRMRRDFSHGCIRLERPADLARLLVKLQTNMSEARLAEIEATDTEKWIKLDKKLPVYLLYFTAWAEESGTVRFHHDIYGRDEQLEGQKKERLEDGGRTSPERLRAVATATATATGN